MISCGGTPDSVGLPGFIGSGVRALRPAGATILRLSCSLLPFPSGALAAPTTSVVNGSEDYSAGICDIYQGTFREAIVN